MCRTARSPRTRSIPRSASMASLHCASSTSSRRSPPAIELLQEAASRVDAILIGPGMQDESATCGLVRALLRTVSGTPVVLDACAMGAVKDRDDARSDAPPMLITPHAGEMAHLMER